MRVAGRTAARTVHSCIQRVLGWFVSGDMWEGYGFTEFPQEGSWTRVSPRKPKGSANVARMSRLSSCRLSGWTLVKAAMRGLSVVVRDISYEGLLPSERLLPLVYDELRRLAASRMMGESPGHTLQPTALVHEAWLRLEDGGANIWENQGHFFAAAARAMRRILVDRARQKSAFKRQPGERFPDPAADQLPERDDHLLLIHESLARLEKEDPEAAEIVLLKFFSGLGSKEIAGMTGNSVRSVERCWTFAKARLYQMMREEM